MKLPTEKDKLELAAISNFANALKSEPSAPRLDFIELRRPPEPDAYCLADGQPLHVEVGHIYGTQSDARFLLGRTGKSAPSQRQQLQSNMIPLDMRLLPPLNKLLAEKATKTYMSPRVWLLIRNAMPLWERRDFEHHLQDIALPEIHPFEQIWLLCGRKAAAGLLRLA